MPPAVNAHMVKSEELTEIFEEHSWLFFTFDISGEIGLKTYTTYTNNHQEKVAMAVARPICFLTVLLTPFFWIYDKIKVSKKTEEEESPAIIQKD